MFFPCKSAHETWALLRRSWVMIVTDHVLCLQSAYELWAMLRRFGVKHNQVDNSLRNNPAHVGSVFLTKKKKKKSLQFQKYYDD